MNVDMVTMPLDGTAYSAREFGAYMSTRTRGVYAQDGEFPLTANGDMTLTLGAGRAWIDVEHTWGAIMYTESDEVLNFELADEYLDRIDTVVLRHDKMLNKSYIFVQMGLPASAPVPIMPARDANYRDLVIYGARVRANAIDIKTSDIISYMMDESMCGIMSDGVTRLPSQAFQDQINLFISDNQELFTESLAMSKAEFEIWYESIKDILDESAAGNLLNLINEMKDPAVVGSLQNQIDSLGDSANADIANNLTTEEEGYVLDARMGKALNDAFGNMVASENILTDALLISADNPRWAINYSKWRCLAGTTANLPSSVTVGVREYYYFNDNWFVIKITEFAPSMGRIWYNSYDKNTGKWRGWTEK